MKVLFVFTGGTIGSTQREGIISTDAEKKYRLLEEYRAKYGIDFEYELVEPYTELSENNTGWHIKTLIGCLKKNISNGYDGVIVTHGTDTLQYSAAAIGYCFGAESVPICIVSANSPIEAQNSNALDNLRGAVCFIEQRCGKGAFAIYRNSKSDTVVVHRATRLIASNAYSDELLSAEGKIYGTFKKNFDFVRNPSYHELTDDMQPLNAYALKDYCNDIMVIEPYVGMSYPLITKDIKYILLNTYHSGTINTSSQESIAFFESAQKSNVKVYVTGVISGVKYSSSERFKELGISLIPSLSPIAAYVKLWLISSLDKEDKELLGLSLCGDIII